MSMVSLRIPHFLYKKVKEMAKSDGVSINQFIAKALAEKLSALKTEEYLENRAKRANRDKFEATLSKVGNNTGPFQKLHI